MVLCLLIIINTIISSVDIEMLICRYKTKKVSHKYIVWFFHCIIFQIITQQDRMTKVPYQGKSVFVYSDQRSTLMMMEQIFVAVFNC